MQRMVLGAAGVIGAIGVAAAAWIQHRLAGGTDADQLDFASTAVRFALVHAAVLVGIAALLRDGIGRAARICLGAAAASFIGGFVFFCGGLWLLAANGSPAWAHTVPIGGTLFIVGWIAILAAALAPRPAG
ncbi:MAG TPA: DUF423 domain-containing protein [Stellaceae bacterium]|jgi:uncharacterized membrane protein YgdD (TMEM256/DUF423 family)|nr:DUF423 domain-containing protein [Stellaceae bacterium]